MIMMAEVKQSPAMWDVMECLSMAESRIDPLSTSFFVSRFLPPQHDDHSQRGQEDPRDHLQSDEEPAVRDHLHEEVLLVLVHLAHALLGGELLGAECPEKALRLIRKSTYQFYEVLTGWTAPL